MKRKSASAQPSRKTRKTRLISVSRSLSQALQDKILHEVRARVATTRPIAPTPLFFGLKIPKLGLERLSIPVMPTWRSFAAFLVFAFATIGFYALMFATVEAAPYVGPTLAPPGGNVPVTIWNRISSNALQTNAAIAVDGGGPTMGTFVGMQVGSTTLDLGVGASGQNLIYGLADISKMNAADNLFLLQTFTSPATYTTRFSVTRNGNVTASGSLTAGALAVTNVTSSAGITNNSGNVVLANAGTAGELQLREPSAGGAHYSAFKAQLQAANVTYTLPATAGSSGQALVTDGLGALSWSAVNACSAVRKYVGLGTSGTGSQGGYGGVAFNAVCAAFGASASVCTVDEMLNSTKCAVTLPASGDAWVSGGPPGFTAPANDCSGWTSATGTQLGRIWRFDATKGKGFLTTCNQSIAFACCQ